MLKSLGDSDHELAIRLGLLANLVTFSEIETVAVSLGNLLTVLHYSYGTVRSYKRTEQIAARFKNALASSRCDLERSSRV